MYIQDMQSLMFIPSCCFSTSFINNNCTKFPLMISDILHHKKGLQKNLWIELKRNKSWNRGLILGVWRVHFCGRTTMKVSGTSMDGVGMEKKFILCCMDIESSSTVMKNYFCMHKHSRKASQFQWIVWGWGRQHKKAAAIIKFCYQAFFQRTFFLYVHSTA